uniref:HAP2 n=1 Tax=Arundo donax TaxID=35708 RepID=A0A0A9DQS2_ARUDO
MGRISFSFDHFIKNVSTRQRYAAIRTTWTAHRLVNANVEKKVSIMRRS